MRVIIDCPAIRSGHATILGGLSANRKLGRFHFDSEIWGDWEMPVCELCARLVRVFGLGKAPF